MALSQQRSPMRHLRPTTRQARAAGLAAVATMMLLLATAWSLSKEEGAATRRAAPSMTRIAVVPAIPAAAAAAAASNGTTTPTASPTLDPLPMCKFDNGTCYACPGSLGTFFDAHSATPGGCCERCAAIPLCQYWTVDDGVCYVSAHKGTVSKRWKCNAGSCPRHVRAAAKAADAAKAAADAALALRTTTPAPKRKKYSAASHVPKCMHDCVKQFGPANNCSVYLHLVDSDCIADCDAQFVMGLASISKKCKSNPTFLADQRRKEAEAEKTRQTNMCFHEEGWCYHGNDLVFSDNHKVGNPGGCCRACLDMPQCKFWTLSPKNVCFLKSLDRGRKQGQCISGSRKPPTKYQLVSMKTQFKLWEKTHGPGAKKTKAADPTLAPTLEPTKAAQPTPAAPSLAPTASPTVRPPPTPVPPTPPPTPMRGGVAHGMCVPTREGGWTTDARMMHARACCTACKAKAGCKRWNVDWDAKVCSHTAVVNYNHTGPCTSGTSAATCENIQDRLPSTAPTHRPLATAAVPAPASLLPTPATLPMPSTEPSQQTAAAPTHAPTRHRRPLTGSDAAAKAVVTKSTAPAPARQQRSGDLVDEQQPELNDEDKVDEVEMGGDDASLPPKSMRHEGERTRRRRDRRRPDHGRFGRHGNDDREDDAYDEGKEDDDDGSVRKDRRRREDDYYDDYDHHGDGYDDDDYDYYHDDDYGRHEHGRGRGRGRGRERERERGRERGRERERRHGRDRERETGEEGDGAVDSGDSSKGICVQSNSGWCYNGHELGWSSDPRVTKSPGLCCGACRDQPSCTFWTLKKGICLLTGQVQGGGRIESDDCVSGPVSQDRAQIEAAFVHPSLVPTSSSPTPRPTAAKTSAPTPWPTAAPPTVHPTPLALGAAWASQLQGNGSSGGAVVAKIASLVAAETNAEAALKTQAQALAADKAALEKEEEDNKELRQEQAKLTDELRDVEAGKSERKAQEAQAGASMEDHSMVLRLETQVHTLSAALAHVITGSTSKGGGGGGSGDGSSSSTPSSSAGITRDSVEAAVQSVAAADAAALKRAERSRPTRGEEERQEKSRNAAAAAATTTAPNVTTTTTAAAARRVGGIHVRLRQRSRPEPAVVHESPSPPASQASLRQERTTRKIFNQVDADADGSISAVELVALSKSATEMLQASDRDGDGAISLDEFEALTQKNWAALRYLSNAVRAAARHAGRPLKRR